MFNMTKQRFNELFQKRVDRVWEHIYAKGFCEGLDEGLSLDEACEKGDLRVLNATRKYYEEVELDPLEV